VLVDMSVVSYGGILRPVVRVISSLCKKVRSNKLQNVIKSLRPFVIFVWQ